MAKKQFMEEIFYFVLRFHDGREGTEQVAGIGSWEIAPSNAIVKQKYEAE